MQGGFEVSAEGLFKFLVSSCGSELRPESYDGGSIQRPWCGAQYLQVNAKCYVLKLKVSCY